MAVTTGTGLLGRTLEAAVSAACEQPRVVLGSPVPSPSTVASPQQPRSPLARSPPHGVPVLKAVSSHEFGFTFLSQRVRRPLPQSGPARASRGGRGLASPGPGWQGLTRAGLGSPFKGILSATEGCGQLVEQPNDRMENAFIRRCSLSLQKTQPEANGSHAWAPLLQGPLGQPHAPGLAPGHETVAVCALFGDTVLRKKRQEEGGPWE